MSSPSNIKRLYEAAVRDRQPSRFFDEFQEALDKGEVKPGDFSVRQLFETFVEDGPSIASEWRHSPESRKSLLEAGVNTTAFSNITGQLMVNEVMAAYDNPAYIADQLVTVRPTRLPRGEKIIGLSQIGDEAEAIGEAQPYPFVGFGEDWIETPETIKRGMICPITREAIVEDLTGQILDRARQVGDWIRYNREIRILQAALGINTTYKRKNFAAVATYGDASAGTGHEFDNLVASNALADWTDIENAELLFDAMLDPNTGTPITVMANTLVVPTALKHTAMRVLNATEIRVGDITTGTGQQTISANPVAGAYNIVTSQLVKTVTGSASTWFLGDFPGAFRYMEVSPIQVVQAPTNSHDEFHRDIVAQWKVSEWGAPAVVEPRKVVKCTG